MANLQTKRRFEKKHYPKIRRALRDLLNQALELMRRDGKLTDAGLESYLKMDKVEEAYTNLYRDVYPYFAKWQGKQIARQLKSEFTDWDAMAEEYLYEKFFNQRILFSVKATQKKTFMNLYEQIQAEAVELGYDTERTSRFLNTELKKRGIEQQLWQSRRIVQTEVFGSSNKAQFDAALSFGVRQVKIWVVSGAGKTQRHALTMGADGNPLHNQTRELNEPFTFYSQDGRLVSAMHPMDSSLPPCDSINCQCDFLLKVVRDDE